MTVILNMLMVILSEENSAIILSIMEHTLLHKTNAIMLVHTKMDSLTVEHGIIKTEKSLKIFRD